MITRLCLDKSQSIMVDKLQIIDPYETFLGKTNQSDQETFTYVTKVIHGLSYWPEDKSVHYSKSSKNMPVLDQGEENILVGRDYCDLIPCLSEGTAYELIRDFIADLEKYPGEDLNNVPSDVSFWDERYIKALLNRFKANSKHILGQENTNYLKLLLQIQNLKELRNSQQNYRDLELRVEREVRSHKADLRYKINGFVTIMTSLKEEVKQLKELSDKVDTDSECEIFDELESELSSVSETMKLMGTIELSNTARVIQSKVGNILVDAQILVSELTKFRSEITSLSEKIVSFDPEDIIKEIITLKDEMESKLKSVSEFSDRINGDFSSLWCS